jgi:hypothetical protein
VVFQNLKFPAGEYAGLAEDFSRDFAFAYIVQFGGF